MIYLEGITDVQNRENAEKRRCKINNVRLKAVRYVAFQKPDNEFQRKLADCQRRAMNNAFEKQIVDGYANAPRLGMPLGLK